MSDQAPSLLICCFDVLPGHSGLSRRVTEYLKGIGDKFQVVVLSNKTPDHSHIERYLGARLLRVPIGGGDLQSRIQAFDRAVRRQLESEEYQIVHFFDPFGGYALCEGREGPNYRLVYDAQTFPSQELRYTHPHTEGDRRFLSKVRRQELYCLMNSDAVITGSDVTRKFILDQGVPEAQVRVLRGPVELSLYTSDVLGRPDATPMKVLYLGSQLGYQGLPTLLRAMQLTVRQVDVRLTIIGPKHNEWQAHLSDLVNELKLAGKVEFQAPVAHDDLHKIVATCDLGALPLDDNERNRSQGGPMAKLGEYLAGGRPVIASDLPITRELVPEGAGVFFPCGDFKKLAESLIVLAQNPAQRVEMGKAARAGAEKIDASWIRGQLLDVYTDVVGKKLGSAAAQSTGEITRAGKAPAPKEDSSKRKTPKTDPAIKSPGDPSTDPEARLATEGPAILGTPIHEEKEDPSRGALTDRVSGPSEAVVMGVPLADGPVEPTPKEVPREPPAPKPLKDRRTTPARGNPNKDKDKDSKPDVTPVAAPPPPIKSPEPPRADGRRTPARGSAPAPAASAEKPAEKSKGRAIAAQPSGRHPAIPGGKPDPRMTPARGLPSATAFPGRSEGPRDPPPEPTPIKRPSLLKSNPAAPAAPAVVENAELPPITRAQGASHLPAVRAVAAAAPPVLAPAPLPPPAPAAEAAPPPAAAATAADAEKSVEVNDDEVQEIADDEVLADPAAATGDDDADDSSDESGEVMDADAAEAESIESDQSPLPSRLDPWLAQLVHGYCPPDAPAFNRHTPPTNFPGRD